MHDVYCRHRDKTFLDHLSANHFVCNFVPANRTDDLQLHDVYYNKLHKGGVRQKFDSWCVTDLANKIEQGGPNFVPTIDYGMGTLKPLIAQFTAESIKEVPKEAAVTALKKIGIDKCFTVEFQTEAESMRESLNMMGNGNNIGVIEASSESESSGNDESGEVNSEAVEIIGGVVDEINSGDNSKLIDKDSGDEEQIVPTEGRKGNGIADMIEDRSDSEVEAEENFNFKGRMVCVKFGRRLDPGIIVGHTQDEDVTKLIFEVEFEDEDNPFYDDIKYSELIFVDCK